MPGQLLILMKSDVIYCEARLNLGLSLEELQILRILCRHGYGLIDFLQLLSEKVDDNLHEIIFALLGDILLSELSDHRLKCKSFYFDDPAFLFNRLLLVLNQLPAHQ